jgi:hydroxymethylpyrimidine/phosphomethylpyrimidine kinase
MRRVLAIAGWDSSGWAGLAADLRTLHHLKCGGQGVITARTEQTPTAILRIEPREPAELLADLGPILAAPIHAVKVGMVATPTLAAAIATALEALESPLVVDPIWRSSTGTVLFRGSPSGLAPLLAMATVITPNRSEAAWLLEGGSPAAWCAQVGTAMLLTNGGEDTLFLPDGQVHPIHAEPTPGADPAGTGCTLSSALAAHLAHDPTDILGASRAAVAYTAAQVAQVGAGPRQPLLHRDG